MRAWCALRHGSSAPCADRRRFVSRCAVQTVQSVLWQDGQPLPVVANLMVGGTDSKLMQRYSKQGALRMMP